MSIQVTLVGRLGADPELKFGQNGKGICKLRVVTSGRRMVDGKWEDVDTTWWSVTAFGPVAEQCVEYLSKGSAVVVVGKAKEDVWTDKDGNERRSVAVLADTVAQDLRWLSQVGRSKGAPIEDDPWKLSDPAHAPF
jgi:single-strand DNA-binding protein